MPEYEITFTRVQTTTIKKSFASYEDAERWANDPRSVDGSSCLLDEPFDELEDTYEITEVEKSDEHDELEAHQWEREQDWHDSKATRRDSIREYRGIL